MTLEAKTVLKNKFWIVEQQGEKIATIQAVEDGGFVYASSNERKRYPSIKILSKEHNVVFDEPAKKSKIAVEHEVHGYPTNCKPWNVLYDVKHQFPILCKMFWFHMNQIEVKIFQIEKRNSFISCFL